MKELERGTGILLPIASLPSKHGIGTLGDGAYSFINLLADLHMRYWQVLPIGPTGFMDSPYVSFSVFAGNPYYVDLDELKSLGLLTDAEIEMHSKESQKIDYEFLFEHRIEVLRLAFARFDTNEVNFKKFVSANAEWLHDYSLFMTARDVYGHQGWWNWPVAIRDRSGDEFEAFVSEHSDEVLFYEFIQYMFFDQWTQLKQYATLKGVSIIGELPLYTALDSSDAWVNRKYYEVSEDGSMEFCAGYPPDGLHPDGQHWGNPLYNYHAMEEDGFLWWKNRVTWATDKFDVVRVNHVRGLINYYCVPRDGFDGNVGHWSKGPGRKLADIICQSAGETPVFAEDFGTAMLPQVSKLLDKLSWSGMKVLLYAFDSDNTNTYLPHTFETDRNVVYLTTPDSETVTGYFKKKTESTLEYLYSYLNINSKEEIPNALIRLAYSANSRVVILQMQDILGLSNDSCLIQPNDPGASWTWRLNHNAIPEEKRKLFRSLSRLYRR